MRGLQQRSDRRELDPRRTGTVLLAVAKKIDDRISQALPVRALEAALFRAVDRKIGSDPRALR